MTRTAPSSACLARATRTCIARTPGTRRIPTLRLAVPVGVALALALALAGPVAAADPSPGASAAVSTPTFAPDPAAAELARLLNGERTTHGLAALAVDPFLAVKARDGAVACPDGSGTMAGRARDMAISAYFSHALRLCPAYGALDAMAAWGYTAARGEIIAMNTGYGYGSTSYRWGCELDGTGCDGAATTAPATVARAASGFMTSSGHRAIVLSAAYDRFACGAWQVAEGGTPGTYSRYYACMFAFGPGTAVEPAPPATDTTAPSISRRATRVGGTWTFRATFRDPGGLAGATISLDGRRLSRWTLAGLCSATRTVRKRTGSLHRGWHTVAWTARDAAGNSRAVRIRFWNRGW